MIRKHIREDESDPLSIKKKFSEQKRKEALKLRQTESRQRQSAINQALSNVDQRTQVNRKITFSDEILKGDDLFPDEDDTDIRHDEFDIAPQFEGKKGYKLLEIQNRFGNDDRFRLDSRFAGNSDDENESDETDSEKESSEYKTNMKTLHKVVDIAKKPSEKRQLFKDTGTLRYDPTKGDSIRFKRTEENKDKKPVTVEKEPEQIPEVSSERFYQISQDFRETLMQQNGESFSLLKSFSGGLHLTNENEEDPVQKFREVKESPSKETTPKTSEPSKPKHSVPHPKALAGSRFFIYPGDYRLKEGVNFFCRQRDMEDVRQEWSKRRENVQKIFQLKNRRATNKNWKPPRKNKNRSSKRN